jgi:hypothetical protein
MFKFTIIAIVTGTAIVSFSLILFNSRTIEPSTAQSLHQSQDTSLSLSVPELPPLKEEIYLPSIPQKQLLSSNGFQPIAFRRMKTEKML